MDAERSASRVGDSARGDHASHSTSSAQHRGTRHRRESNCDRAVHGAVGGSRPAGALTRDRGRGIRPARATTTAGNSVGRSRCRSLKTSVHGTLPATLPVVSDWKQGGSSMIRQLQILALAALTAVAACDRQNNRLADSSLNNDLSLAQQQRGYQPLDSLSLAERGLTATPNRPVPAPARTATTTRRTTSSGGEVTRRRSTRSSNGGTTSGSSASSTTTSGGTVEKHTKRDAAIGAAAGAIIGATTSRNKAKGAVIGGVVGGILGGVIGNNVDVKKKKP